MIAAVIVLLAAAVYLMFRRADSPPEHLTPADFDFLTVSEQIEQIGRAKDALADCEALETLAEMSAADMQQAVRISWTDEADHELTVFLAGDYTAECIRMLAAREAQELRGELAAEIMQANSAVNGIEKYCANSSRGGEGRA